MTKNVIVANTDIPVIDGKMPCIKCHDLKLPDEMNLERLCLSCLEEIKVRNAGKPKPKTKPKKVEKRNGAGWIERSEELPLMEDFKIEVDPAKAKMITGDGTRVSETIKPENLLTKKDLIKIPDNNDDKFAQILIDIAQINGKISQIDSRLIEIETTLEDIAFDQAQIKRRLTQLEQKTIPIIKIQDEKQNNTGLKKLRDELLSLLQERHAKTQNNGIYVKDLYGPKGRPGGKLNISKAAAFRLKDYCRIDKRFKIERSNTQSGEWLIRLNLYMT